MPTVRKLVGESEAKKLWDLSIEAIHVTHQLVEKFQIDCDWQWGPVHTAVKLGKSKSKKASEMI